MTPHSVSYDPSVDQLYIAFQARRPGGATRTEHLDDDRRVDYSADGALYGIEIDSPSRGIAVEGLPEGEAVAAALERMAAEHGWARVRA